MELQIFNNPEFGKIRVTGTPENPLFCLADVCKALEIGNPSDVKNRLSDGVVSIEVITDSLGRKQNAMFVNEDGLYDVILDSRKPEARRFRKWVTSEVLPSIRKYGVYATKDAAEYFLQNPEQAAKVFMELATERKEKARLVEENAILAQQVFEMTPKANYYDLILQCKHAIPVTIIAKDYGMSPKKFNQLLHKLGIQYKVGGTWVLYSCYENRGWTATKTHSYTHKSTNISDAAVHTYWTQQGRQALYELLKHKGYLPLIELNER